MANRVLPTAMITVPVRQLQGHKASAVITAPDPSGRPGSGRLRLTRILRSKDSAMPRQARCVSEQTARPGNTRWSGPSVYCPCIVRW